MSGNTALVVGISGIVGRTLADHLSTLGDWTVLGVSRPTRTTTLARRGARQWT